jgi:hypothetical protein
MKALILGLSVALSGGEAGEQPRGFPGPSSFGSEVVIELEKMHDFAWFAACDAKQIDCTGLDRPRVGYVVIEDALGQYYYGAHIVEVDIRMLGQQASILVVVHEMLHYLQWGMGQTTFGSRGYLTPCEREKEAFTLTYQVSAEYSIAVADKRITPWSAIVHRYEGCSPKVVPDVSR